MNPQTFIFIGRSGSGKGTQAKLLQAFLQQETPSTPICYLQTGQEFRDFIQGQSHTQKTSAALYATGALQPEFLSIYMWAKYFTEKLTGKEHLIIDGTPRKLEEATVLHSAMDFYKRQKPTVFFMNISEAEARKRLLERHRLDDNVRDIEKRLAWYKTDVEPAVEWYRKQPSYDFVEVNGEQPIEEIQKNIWHSLKQLRK